MNICHITTFWPDHSAISNYTEALIFGIRATRSYKHIIIAENSGEVADNEAFQCIPCWNRNEDYVDSIVHAVLSVRADIVVVQYIDDLLGKDDRLPRLLKKLKEHRIPTAVNCHSIYPIHWRTGFSPGGDSASLDRALAEQATCLTVHSNRMRQDLIERGIDPEKVVVIPHGSRLLEPRDRLKSRMSLGVPGDAKMVLFFGFIWLGKGLNFLLNVFAEVVKRVPNSFLFIGGHTRKKAFYTRMYMNYLGVRTLWLGIAKRTLFWGDYVPEDVAMDLYSATDLVALPYKQNYSSVSGVVHQAAGMGIPILCSSIAKFDEVGERISPGLLVGPSDKKGWVEVMCRLLTDQSWADEIRSRIRKFASETSWEEIGKIHLKLYDTLVDRIEPS